jgi:DNA-binding NtrC family response regulator
MKDLPDYLTSLDPGVTSVRSAGFTGRTYREARNTWLSDFESTYAEELLRRNGGNISRAARAAAVDRKTFRKFLKRNTKES